jgi:hypothetical protein
VDSLASRSYALPPQAKADVTTMFRRAHPAPISKKNLAASWHFGAGGSLECVSAALAVSPGKAGDRGTEKGNPVIPGRHDPNAERSYRFLSLLTASEGPLDTWAATRSLKWSRVRPSRQASTPVALIL